MWRHLEFVKWKVSKIPIGNSSVQSANGFSTCVVDSALGNTLHTWNDDQWTLLYYLLYTMLHKFDYGVSSVQCVAHVENPFGPCTEKLLIGIFDTFLLTNPKWRHTQWGGNYFAPNLSHCASVTWEHCHQPKTFNIHCKSIQWKMGHP